MRQQKLSILLFTFTLLLAFEQSLCLPARPPVKGASDDVKVSESGAAKGGAVVAEKPVVVPEKVVIPAVVPEKPIISPQPEKPVVAPVPEKPAISAVPEKPIISPLPEKPVISPQPEKPVPAVPEKPAEIGTPPEEPAPLEKSTEEPKKELDKTADEVKSTEAPVKKADNGKPKPESKVLNGPVFKKGYPTTFIGPEGKTYKLPLSEAETEYLSTYGPSRRPKPRLNYLDSTTPNAKDIRVMYVWMHIGNFIMYISPDFYQNESDSTV